MTAAITAKAGAAPTAKDTIITLRADTITVDDAALQLPAPASAVVFVHPHEARAGGLIGRLKPRKTVSRAIRSSALLARGYVEIGADEIDGVDWVWGCGERDA